AASLVTVTVSFTPPKTSVMGKASLSFTDAGGFGFLETGLADCQLIVAHRKVGKEEYSSRSSCSGAFNAGPCICYHNVGVGYRAPTRIGYGAGDVPRDFLRRKARSNSKQQKCYQANCFDAHEATPLERIWKKAPRPVDRQRSKLRWEWCERSSIP